MFFARLFILIFFMVSFGGPLQEAEGILPLVALPFLWHFLQPRTPVTTPPPSFYIEQGRKTLADIAAAKNALDFATEKLIRTYSSHNFTLSPPEGHNSSAYDHIKVERVKRFAFALFGTQIPHTSFPVQCNETGCSVQCNDTACWENLRRKREAIAEYPSPADLPREVRSSDDSIHNRADSSDPMDYEYVTKLYFKERGQIAGATTYGHLTFRMDLTFVDRSLQTLQDYLNHFRQDLKEKKILKRSFQDIVPVPPQDEYRNKDRDLLDRAERAGFYSNPDNDKIIQYYTRLISEEEKLGQHDQQGARVSAATIPVTDVSHEYEAYKQAHWLDLPSDPIVELISYREASNCWNRGILVSTAERSNDLRPYEDVVIGARKLTDQEVITAVAQGNSSVSERYRRAASTMEELDRSLQQATDYADEMIDEWESVKMSVGIRDSDFSKSSRSKRFIPLIIGGIAALFGATGTVMGAVATNQLLDIEKAAEAEEQREQLRADVNSQQHDFIVSKLQHVTEHATNMESKLQDIIRGTEWAEKHVSELIAEVRYIKITNQISALQALARGSIDRMKSGLTAILHQQLSPILVNATLVNNALQGMLRKAEAAGFDTPAHTLTWAYQLPASFIGHPNGSISIYVHVPLHMRSLLLNLYEYLDVPVAIEGSKHSLTIEPETRYIAVNPDRDGFILLKETDLEKCTTIGSFFWCQHYNYQMKEPSKYCISSLFWRLQESAHKICKTAVATDAVQIIQSSPNDFHLFHPQPMSLAIQCPGQHERHLEWRGSKQIQLDAGCRGFGRGYEVNAYPVYSVNITVVTNQLSWTTRQLTLNLPPIKLDEMLPEPPKVKVMVEDLVAQYNQVARTEKFISVLNPGHLINNLFGGLLSTMGIIAIILMICCCFKDRIKSAFDALFNSQPTSAPGDDNQSVVSFQSQAGGRRHRFRLPRGLIRNIRESASKMGSRAASMVSLNSISNWWKQPHANVSRELREVRRDQHVSFRPPPTPGPSSAPPEDPNNYVEIHPMQSSRTRDVETSA